MRPTDVGGRVVLEAGIFQNKSAFHIEIGQVAGNGESPAPPHRGRPTTLKLIFWFCSYTSVNFEGKSSGLAKLGMAK